MKPSEIMKEHGAWTGLGKVLDKKCISKEQNEKELKEMTKNFVDSQQEVSLWIEENQKLKKELSEIKVLAKQIAESSDKNMDELLNLIWRV